MTSRGATVVTAFRTDARPTPLGTHGVDRYARLQEDLAQRHSLNLSVERVRDHPDRRDLLNLPVLLRQASVVVDGELNAVLALREPRLEPLGLDLLRRVRDRPQTGADLAVYLRVSKQRVSDLVARLVEMGLVDAEPCGSDRRRRRLHLTEHGLDHLEAVEQDVVALVHLLLDDLGIDAHDTLMGLVAVLAEEG